MNSIKQINLLPLFPPESKFSHPKWRLKAYQGSLAIFLISVGAGLWLVADAYTTDPLSGSIGAIGIILLGWLGPSGLLYVFLKIVEEIKSEREP